MAKATLLVFTNPPADRELEFNAWYDNVHIPDLLTVEGIIGARRYKLAGPGPRMQVRDDPPAVAQYLAMYDLDNDDTRTMIRRVAEASAEFGRRGRMFEGLQVVASPTYVLLNEWQT